jgi:hypothetical protein
MIHIKSSDSSFVGFIQSTIRPKKNLYDVRDAELNIVVNDLPKLIAERNKFPKHIDHVSVFLLGKPKETVLGTLLIKYTRDQYNVHICSSTEKAIFILQIPSTKRILEERLNTLTNKY